MDKEMARHLEIIRDRNLPMMPFRYHSNILAEYLTVELLAKIPTHRWSDIVPVLIFRASLVFWPSLVKNLPDSPIGFMGLKRNEKTAVAEKYFSSLAKANSNSIIAILDPMLGTAGTIRKTVEEIDSGYLADNGRRMIRSNVYYVGFLAAECGYREALKHIPANNVILLAVDPELDAQKFIVPGLGDFGDRYFGS